MKPLSVSYLVIFPRLLHGVDVSFHSVQPDFRERGDDAVKDQDTLKHLPGLLVQAVVCSECDACPQEVRSLDVKQHEGVLADVAEHAAVVHSQEELT